MTFIGVHEVHVLPLADTRLTASVAVMVPGANEVCIAYRIIDDDVAERNKTILHEVYRLPLTDGDTLRDRVTVHQPVTGAVLVDDDCM